MSRWLILALLVSPAVAQQAVTLQWTASTTAGTTVSAYRATSCSGTFVKVGVNLPAGGPWNTVIPSTPGTTVAFQVTAVLPGQPESAPSNCFLFTIPAAAAPQPPASPTGLTGTMSPQ